MNVISALGLLMLLSGCSSHIEPTQVEVITILPEPGLITLCDKPRLMGTTPAQTVAEDVPRLKVALSECAAQASEYLKWYANQTAIINQK